jgi:DNA-directed RNA polymerase specialized sigma24 family protein
LKTGERSTTEKQRGEALPDDEVARRVRAGRTDLLELLFRRHGQRVYRIARAIVRDDAEAADVVQETYLRAYDHLDQFAFRFGGARCERMIATFVGRASSSA